MALTKEAEMVGKLAEIFMPVVYQDKDIVDFFEKNGMSKEERSIAVVWLACATINSIFTLDKNNKQMMKYAKIAKLSCDTAEKELSKNYKGIKKVLIELLAENMNEWVGIIVKHFKDLGFMDDNGNPIFENLPGHKKNKK